MKLADVNYLLNGVAHGSIAHKFMASGGDPNVFRPFVDNDGQSRILRVNADGKVRSIVTNSTSLLRPDEWQEIDNAVVDTARAETRVWADLRSRGAYNVRGGMGTTELLTQTVGNMTPARMSMDGLADSENDAVEFDLKTIPLPFIHKQFRIPLRLLETSRKNGTALDTIQVREAASVCVDLLEQLTLGVIDPYAYGGNAVYGYRNFPQRLTYSLTAPTSGSWTPRTLVQQLVAMKKLSTDAFHRGPWRIYVGPDWAPYIDDDYTSTYGGVTLRQRLLQTEGFSSIRTSEYLPDYDIIMVMEDPKVARAVTAMDWTTLQWEEKAGLALNFMILGIMLPQLRADQNGQTGLVHGAV